MAIYLKSGSIVYKLKNKVIKEVYLPSFIGVEETIKGKAAKFNIEIQKGSEIIMLSKLDILKHLSSR